MRMDEFNVILISREGCENGDYKHMSKLACQRNLGHLFGDGATVFLKNGKSSH